MDVQSSADEMDGNRCAVERHRESWVLCEGWSSTGKRPDDRSGREPGVSRFWRSCYKRHGWGLIDCEWTINRLVAQMADSAVRLRGAGVMMAHAHERHAHQQERQQSYRDDQAPIWPWLVHVRLWSW